MQHLPKCQFYSKINHHLLWISQKKDDTVYVNKWNINVSQIFECVWIIKLCSYYNRKFYSNLLCQNFAFVVVLFNDAESFRQVSNIFHLYKAKIVTFPDKESPVIVVNVRDSPGIVGVKAHPAHFVPESVLHVFSWRSWGKNNNNEPTSFQVSALNPVQTPYIYIYIYSAVIP